MRSILSHAMAMLMTAYPSPISAPSKESTRGYRTGGSCKKNRAKRFARANGRRMKKGR